MYKALLVNIVVTSAAPSASTDTHFHQSVLLGSSVELVMLVMLAWSIKAQSDL